MPWIYILVLAIVQGLAELLPVSSSAHVIVAAHFLHVNMSLPDNALLLVLLHTGTMFAVIAYFWRRWRATFLASWRQVYGVAKLIFVSSLFSGLVFLPVEHLVIHLLSHGSYHPSIEVLFHKLNWIGPALFIVGLLILYAGLREARQAEESGGDAAGAADGAASAPRRGGAAGGAALAETAVAAPAITHGITWPMAIWMGILQGFAIPFRGFSRSGATISGGLLTGGRREAIESYSFAMVVAITPLAILWELRRVIHSAHAAGVAVHWGAVLPQGLLGMVFAFLAGLLALKWLYRWLEQGRWHWFGIYCLVFAAFVETLYFIH